MSMPPRGYPGRYYAKNPPVGGNRVPQPPGPQGPTVPPVGPTSQPQMPGGIQPPQPPGPMRPTNPPRFPGGQVQQPPSIPTMPPQPPVAPQMPHGNSQWQQFQIANQQGVDPQTFYSASAPPGVDPITFWNAIAPSRNVNVDMLASGTGFPGLPTPGRTALPQMLHRY